MMQIVPFVTETRDVRVIESNIGRVMPIVDIAKALDYDYNSLKGVLKRNSELFEGTVVPVTLTTVQDNRGTEQVRDYEVKALNSYGVFGLLMKLDYNRVQSEEKKQNVIRFQKWAMQVLGDAAIGKKNKKRNISTTKAKVYNRVIRELSVLPEGLEYCDKIEASAILGVSTKTIHRHIIKGLIPAYRRLNDHNKWEYAFSQDDIYMIENRKISNENKGDQS